MSRVRIPPVLRASTGGQKQVEVAGATVGQVIDELVATYPGLEPQLLASDGELNRFVNVFLNDTDVRHLQSLETPVDDRDTLLLLPAMAGGSGEGRAGDPGASDGRAARRPHPWRALRVSRAGRPGLTGLQRSLARRLADHRLARASAPQRGGRPRGPKPHAPQESLRMSFPSRSPIRLIDPRGQRFGAGSSAIVLAVAVGLGLPIVVALVGLALGVSSVLGTHYFAFGRPWPTVRRLLRLGPPSAPEPEVGPRFAQALGATFLALGVVLLAAGIRPLGWLPVGAVVALQALLAVTGYCLGCRLYGLQWWVPEQFDRFVLRRGTGEGSEAG